jgi:hypothetical protein
MSQLLCHISYIFIIFTKLKIKWKYKCINYNIANTPKNTLCHS